VLGYYAALERVERLSAARSVVAERDIQTLHALVMSGGSKKVKPTPYRDGQNVIRDARSRRIVLSIAKSPNLQKTLDFPAGSQYSRR